MVRSSFAKRSPVRFPFSSCDRLLLPPLGPVDSWQEGAKRRIEIRLALRLRLELMDRREVGITEPANAPLELLGGRFPGLHRGLLVQPLGQRSEIETDPIERLGEGFPSAPQSPVRPARLPRPPGGPP